MLVLYAGLVNRPVFVFNKPHTLSTNDCWIGLSLFISLMAGWIPSNNFETGTLSSFLMVSAIRVKSVILVLILVINFCFSCWNAAVLQSGASSVISDNIPLSSSMRSWVSFGMPSSFIIVITMFSAPLSFVNISKQFTICVRSSLLSIRGNNLGGCINFNRSNVSLTHVKSCPSNSSSACSAAACFAAATAAAAAAAAAAASAACSAAACSAAACSAAACSAAACSAAATAAAAAAAAAAASATWSAAAWSAAACCAAATAAATAAAAAAAATAACLRRNICCITVAAAACCADSACWAACCAATTAAAAAAAAAAANAAAAWSAAAWSAAAADADAAEGIAAGGGGGGAFCRNLSIVFSKSIPILPSVLLNESFKSFPAFKIVSLHVVHDSFVGRIWPLIFSNVFANAPFKFEPFSIMPLSAAAPAAAPAAANDGSSNFTSVASFILSLSSIRGGNGCVAIINIKNGVAVAAAAAAVWSSARMWIGGTIFVDLSNIRSKRLIPPTPPAAADADAAPVSSTFTLNSFLNFENARPEIIWGFSNWNNIHFDDSSGFSLICKSGENHILRGLAKSIFTTWTVFNSINVESISARPVVVVVPRDSSNFFFILFVIYMMLLSPAGSNFLSHSALYASGSTNPI